MSTNDVPGAKAENHDVLAMGCWAEHDDGSLIFVYAVEAGRVVYSIFDLAVSPPAAYRDAMPELGFKRQFSWRDGKAAIKWTWHDKTPFPWDKVIKNFKSGTHPVSADEQMSAAQKVAESLNLRAEAIKEKDILDPMGGWQRGANTIMKGIKEVFDSLKS